MLKYVLIHLGMLRYGRYVVICYVWFRFAKARLVRSGTLVFDLLRYVKAGMVALVEVRSSTVR